MTLSFEMVKVEAVIRPFALDAVKPTLKSGELDAGLVVTADDGKLGLVAALGVVEGAGIEKTVKQFAPFAPEDKAKFEFDVKKAAGLTLHNVAVPSPELKAAFGTETVWFGTGDKLLAVSIEPDGKALEAAAAPRLTEGATVRGHHSGGRGQRAVRYGRSTVDQS